MTHNTLHTEIDKPFPTEVRSEADQIVLECVLTEYLKEQVDRFSPYFKNVQLRLAMEW